LAHHSIVEPKSVLDQKATSLRFGGIAIAATMQRMAHDVFISYAHANMPVADATYATYESNGIRCKIDPRDVTPGILYAAAQEEITNRNCNPLHRT